MERGRKLMTRLEAGQSDATVPPAIVGPLLGLVYFIMLPFVGIAAFILIAGYLAKWSLVAMWRRLLQVATSVS